MKRAANLFPECTSYTSLLAAARRAYRANRSSGEANWFVYHLEPLVIELQQELRQGSYCPGAYRTFQVHDPKERLIAAAPFRDRVVHHALCRTLEPVLERCFVFDSYACRTGKGTHKAVERAQYFARRHLFFFKADIATFFASLDQQVLRGLLDRLIKDQDFIRLLQAIIDRHPPGCPQGKGVPIGNMTSQYFANLYLDQLDHYLKEELRIPGYVRYMDDFLLFMNTREELHEARYMVQRFLENRLLLQIHERKSYVAPVFQGIPFLGSRIFPGTVRLNRRTKVRVARKYAERMKAYRKGRLEEEAFLQSTSSLFGHVLQADTLHLRRTWAAHSFGGTV